jgi:hypothetical protein
MAKVNEDLTNSNLQSGNNDSADHGRRGGSPMPAMQKAEADSNALAMV